eukprot:680166-Prorocentrum_minimum.AAC.2
MSSRRDRAPWPPGSPRSTAGRTATAWRTRTARMGPAGDRAAPERRRAWASRSRWAPPAWSGGDVVRLGGATRGAGGARGHATGGVRVDARGAEIIGRDVRGVGGDARGVGGVSTARGRVRGAVDARGATRSATGPEVDALGAGGDARALAIGLAGPPF